MRTPPRPRSPTPSFPPPLESTCALGCRIQLTSRDGSAVSCASGSAASGTDPAPGASSSMPGGATSAAPSCSSC
eukprot:scaffold42167_cov30-Tisochrysis_lutea.AAC.1